MEVCGPQPGNVVGRHELRRRTAMFSFGWRQVHVLGVLVKASRHSCRSTLTI